jgi:hypothetical protein
VADSHYLNIRYLAHYLKIISHSQALIGLGSLRIVQFAAWLGPNSNRTVLVNLLALVVVLGMKLAIWSRYELSGLIRFESLIKSLLVPSP